MMFYSPEEKRKIILDNYDQPSKQVEFEELKKLSNDWKVPFFTFHSLDQGCGDILHLLIVQQNGYIEKCFFSAQQSCLITIAVANILFSNLEGKSIKLVWGLISNCRAMIKGRDYDLNSCSELEVFSDIVKFPHRIECIELVVRGINYILYK